MSNRSLTRFPFVAKADILRAYRPGGQVSDRTFRTLRSRRWISGGLAIRKQRRGRLSGQLRCYSVLNIDAAILARHDQLDEARHAAEQAEQFETQWRATISALAIERDLIDFDGLLAARNEIAHALAPASLHAEQIHAELLQIVGTSVREEFVRIASMTDSWTMLDVLPSKLGLTRPELFPAELIGLVSKHVNQSLQQIAVDSFLPQSAALKVGDFGLLRIEHSAGSSLLSLLAAVAETEDESDENDDEPDLDQDMAKYFSDDPLSESVVGHVEARRKVGETIIVPPRTVPLAS
jgi:hypothetical protein